MSEPDTQDFPEAMASIVGLESNLWCYNLKSKQLKKISELENNWHFGEKDLFVRRLKEDLSTPGFKPRPSVRKPIILIVLPNEMLGSLWLIVCMATG